MMNDICYLICENGTETDDIGNIIPTSVETKVFCEVMSISQSEFFKGADVGLKPSIKLRMWKQDYNLETLVKVNNEIYTIYRTYTVNDIVELYAERRKGNGNSD